MITKRNLKFFIAILLLAFCTSSCTRESEAPLTPPNEIRTLTNEDGSTEEHGCQAAPPVDCQSEINTQIPIEEFTRKFSQCGDLSRRGIAILPILISNLYFYPDSDNLLDSIIKMGPDAADTAPHLIRLLDKYSNQHKNYNKALRALASLGEDGTVAIPYLIDRLNYLRNNQGSSLDIEEITSYLVQLGQYQPELVRPTLLDLAKDYPTTAKNALTLIKKQAKPFDPPWADSNTFGIYTNYCKKIYKDHSNILTLQLPDTADQQAYPYCLANTLQKKGIKALPELITMANRDEIYFRHLAVKYIGAMGDAVDTETREKIIALKDKKYGKDGEFSMDWDINYYMLGQFPDFRN